MSILSGEDCYPALVISLDFELRWGVGGAVAGPGHPYWENIAGARDAADRILTLFEERNIHATWATVGFLFASSREDLESFIPDSLPKYAKRNRNNYSLLRDDDNEADEVRFAPDIVARIMESNGQELASHSFSHYYCNELGQDAETFTSDLHSAKRIAERIGAYPTSYVFPSNQVNSSFLPLLSDAGFRVYRGNSHAARPVFPGKIKSTMNRVWRGLDGYWNLTGHNTISWADIVKESPRNVRASRFLRPGPSKSAMLRALQVRRTVKGFEEAVRRNEIYHLWWHPHNFGRDIESNIGSLERVLDGFEHLRETRGMRSLTMEEAALEAERLQSLRVPEGK